MASSAAACPATRPCPCTTSRASAKPGSPRAPPTRLCSPSARAIPPLRRTGRCPAPWGSQAAPLREGRLTASSAAESASQVQTQELAAVPQVLDPEDKLSDWEMLRIVTQDIPDEEVNELVWECLGYVKSVDMDPETLTVEVKWDNEKVFPKWQAKFPQPPDLLGVTRKYYPEIDAPIKEANSALARSIPQAYKQGLKTVLRPLGWTGFKLASLTPNKTRRAQVANWLVFYRTELRGKSLEELQRIKAAKQAEEEALKVDNPTGTTKQGVV